MAISLAVVPIWLSQWLSEHGVEQLSGIIIVVCGAVCTYLRAAVGRGIDALGVLASHHMWGAGVGV